MTDKPITSATDYELEILQAKLNQKIHDDILDYYGQLASVADPKQSMDVIISALSANLGIVLSQVPEKYQTDYMRISNKLINRSFVAGTESIDFKKWGTIGHA